MSFTAASLLSGQRRRKEVRGQAEHVWRLRGFRAETWMKPFPAHPSSQHQDHVVFLWDEGWGFGKDRRPSVVTAHNNLCQNHLTLPASSAASPNPMSNTTPDGGEKSASSHCYHGNPTLQTGSLKWTKAPDQHGASLRI